MANGFLELKARLEVIEFGRREIAYSRDDERRQVFVGICRDQEYKITECIERIQSEYNELKAQRDTAWEALHDVKQEYETLVEKNRNTQLEMEELIGAGPEGVDQFQECLSNHKYCGQCGSAM